MPEPVPCRDDATREEPPPFWLSPRPFLEPDLPPDDVAEAA
ncbi:hypothetical protein OG762_37165 [Streptomyces sp. NBC_01136]|nr:hypothetical protein OG762_37165 [Streptomyces sp. NBC_01136]